MNTADTRSAARDSIRSTAENLRIEVLKYLGRCGERGATDEEIQLALGMKGNTERPRRRELEKAGAIRSSGTRKTRSGRSAAVWVIAPPPDRDGQLSLFAETPRDRYAEHLNDH